MAEGLILRINDGRSAPWLTPTLGHLPDPVQRKPEKNTEASRGLAKSTFCISLNVRAATLFVFVEFQQQQRVGLVERGRERST